jgi:hypothetical protein
MRNQADYFKENRHVAKYEFGERIFGYWNSIPFVGTIGNDTVINETIGPQFSIHLDLPIRFENTTYNVIVDKQSNFKKITKLIEMEEDVKTTNRKTRR